MAKIVGPLFSMKASGSFGDIIFDRRGFARLKSDYQDRQTATQGDFRQAMVVAKKCTKLCGPTTRQLLRGVADDPAYWSGYLAKNLIGSGRVNYQETMAQYAALEDDQIAWESVATEAGLRPVNIEYASEAAVSPGAQLFALASTLFSLGIYTPIGQPNGNAPAWIEQIVS